MISDKLQLVYLPNKDMGCIPHAHYDLCTLEKEPKNVACILTDKAGAKLIRHWINQHNIDPEDFIGGND